MSNIKPCTEEFGLNENATHTKKANRYLTPMDNSLQENFTFDASVELDPTIVKEFKRKFSLITRARDRFGI